MEVFNLIFSSRARILYQQEDSKYVILDVECLDTKYDMYYVKNKEDALLSIPRESDIVLKQYVLKTDHITGESSSKYLFTGDIINITKGKLNRNYEVVVSNGEIKGRDLITNFLIDIEKLLEDDRTESVLTNMHRNKEGDIIEFE